MLSWEFSGCLNVYIDPEAGWFMLQLILSTLVVCLAVVYALVVLLRGRWQTATVALLGGISACVALEISDLLVLLRPDDLMHWKKMGLV